MNNADFLKGTWKLDTFINTDEEGNTEHVMGMGATGFISYSNDGWVSVEIMKPDRQRYDIPNSTGGTIEQTLCAAHGLFCYGGPFTVDEDNDIVYHHLEFSLIPNWIGSKQKRYIEKESDDVLILKSDPIKIKGKIQTSRLRWTRYNGSGQERV